MNGFYLRILLSLLNSGLFMCQLGVVLWRKQTSPTNHKTQKQGGGGGYTGKVAENDQHYKIDQFAWGYMFTLIKNELSSLLLDKLLINILDP